MNLKTLDLEKVSTLPYRLSIKNNLNTRLNSVSVCGWDCYNSYWNNETNRKIRHILENSAGQHIDDVHSKVSKMNHIYPYSTEDVIQMYIKGDERHRYFDINKIWYNKLYINKDGIITKSPAKPWKTHKSKHKHKEWLKEKKQRGIRNKIITDTLIKLLGNKPLFEFYKNLLKDEKTLIQSIEDTERFWKDYNTNTKRIYKHGKDYRRIYLPKRVSSDEIKLQQVRNDISKIEEGEYNVFYESNVYLYSLQKECHHFEQVIKTQ